MDGFLEKFFPEVYRRRSLLMRTITAIGHDNRNFHSEYDKYGTEKLHPSGWRLSLGLAAVPAVLMTIGGILLPETPNSLTERGFQEKGRKVLEKIRGTSDVHAELEDIIDASELANSVEHPFRNILEKRNRPQLVMAIFMPTFQILTGINSILFRYSQA
ncbi:sugar carrier protein A [Dorcoceras hygrometricum]|uniref:Sugar carrier protein A n=1 Tax=Dorcoceras hygrometricum TaxID=472368 RepID=A0A2Z7BYY5_9LAMI|nr:sugar carrier protein A [Dorcoceras hygrometricum]